VSSTTTAIRKANCVTVERTNHSFVDWLGSARQAQPPEEAASNRILDVFQDSPSTREQVFKTLCRCAEIIIMIHLADHEIRVVRY